MDTEGWKLPVRRVELRPDAGLDPGEWPASVPAGALGLNHEGGSTGAQHATRRDAADLGRALRAVRGPGASRWGFFLRAETMHGLFTHLEQNPGAGRRRDPAFHERSHGESFMEVLDGQRCEGSSLYLLDEPESALSFQRCLALVAILADLAATGTAQVVVAMHSPLLAALPGARVLQADEDGLRETSSRTWPWCTGAVSSATRSATSGTC